MSLKRLDLKQAVSLKEYTTLRVGGPAALFCVIHSPEDLRAVCKDFGTSFYLLGGGSNLLIADRGVMTPVIKLGKEFSFIRQSNDFLEVGAATPLSYLIHYGITYGLTGFHHLVGIPATAGGLVAMSASSFGGSIASLLRKVEVMDREGNSVVVDRDDIAFGYRHTSLTGSIIMRVWFHSRRGTRVKEQTKEILEARLRTQDFTQPSCGCVFKNPPGACAGALIDQCGLKGFIHGGAQISRKHANFIVNCSQASCRDILFLIAKAHDAVQKKFGVVLEEEIQQWS